MQKTPIPSVKRSLDATEIEAMLTTLPGWELDRSGACPALRRHLHCVDKAQQDAVLRALDGLAIRRDHHPEIQIADSVCTIRWWTHSPLGLSPLDGECARETDQLLAAILS